MFSGVYRSMRKPVLKLFCLLLCVFCLWGCGQRPGGKTPESRAPESQTQGSERLGVLAYETGDAGVTITGCDAAAEGEVVIPDEIAGLPVISIGDDAFGGCYDLTSIIIPEGVTSIGGNAFGTCMSLTSIIIPGGVTSIGDGAFIGCGDLHAITIPDGVASIGTAAFYECYSLTSISIPDSVNSIGGKAFMDCTGLNSITIPKAFHSEAEAWRIGIQSLWPDGFALPDSSSK